jgi:hypothetical protein
LAFPPNFTNNWDITFPPDTQLANLLGQDLRNLRVDVMQRMSLLSGTLANRPTPEVVNATWGGAGFGLLYFATDTSQVFQWNGAAWVDVSLLILGISSGGTQGTARIVSTVNLTAQAAAIGATTFYTVPAGQTGLYRFGSDLLITTVGTGGTIQNFALWNNGLAAQGPSLQGSLNATVLGNEGGTSNTMMYVPAGQNIQYQVNFVAITGAPQYSLRIRLEYLG